MFSSKYDAWATPQHFFDVLNEKYRFDVDVCAAPDTAKCEHYFTKEQDALSIDWKAYGQEHFDCSPTCFMNPPYGRGIGEFVKKAYEESLKGCEVVCLLPARTDTKWYHKYIWDKHNDKFRDGVSGSFLQGRLTFGTDEYWQMLWEQQKVPYGKKNSAPFPSMIVVFNKRV